MKRKIVNWDLKIRPLKEVENPYKIELLDGAGNVKDTFVIEYYDRKIVDRIDTFRIFTESTPEARA
jgi:hypothetical protein